MLWNVCVCTSKPELLFLHFGQLRKLAEKLGPETTELQRFLAEVAGADLRAPSSGTWNITETVKSATFSPLPPPSRTSTQQLQQILGKYSFLFPFYQRWAKSNSRYK